MNRLKKHLKPIIAVVTAIICVVTLGVSCFASNSEGSTIRYSPLNIQSIFQFSGIDGYEQHGYLYNSVINVPVVNTLEAGHTYYNVIPVNEGRYCYGKYVLRRPLYNSRIGDLIASFVANKTDFVSYNVPVYCNVLYGGVIHYNVMFDKITISYNADYGTISITGLAIPNTDGIPTDKIITLFHQSIIGYNENSVKYAVAQTDYSDTNIYIDCDLNYYYPVYIPELIKYNNSDTAQYENSPLYLYMAMTDGLWFENANCYVDNYYYEDAYNGNYYLQKYRINNKTIVDDGDYQLQFSLGPLIVKNSTLSNEQLTFNATGIDNEYDTLKWQYRITYSYFKYDDDTKTYSTATNTISGVYTANSATDKVSLVPIDKIREATPEVADYEYLNIETFYLYANLNARPVDYSYGTLYSGDTVVNFFIPEDYLKYTTAQYFRGTGIINLSPPDWMDGNFFRWVTQLINGVLNIKLLPQITIGALVWFAVGLGVFFLILKMFAGG